MNPLENKALQNRVHNSWNILYINLSHETVAAGTWSDGELCYNSTDKVNSIK